MKLNEEQLRFFYNEILGELEWGDEEEESGIDPLAFVLREIKKMRFKRAAHTDAVLAESE